RHVRPVAEIDPFLTITGFRVTPVLATVPPDLPLVPSEVEGRVTSVSRGFSTALDTNGWRGSINPASSCAKALYGTTVNAATITAAGRARQMTGNSLLI
ncbi:hypothetical protein ACTGXK_11835, partial [Streptococcus suis]